MSIEKEDLLTWFFRSQGYTWNQAIEKVDAIKAKEEGIEC